MDGVVIDLSSGSENESPNEPVRKKSKLEGIVSPLDAIILLTDDEQADLMNSSGDTVVLNKDIEGNRNEIIDTILPRLLLDEKSGQHGNGKDTIGEKKVTTENPGQDVPELPEIEAEVSPKPQPVKEEEDCSDGNLLTVLREEPYKPDLPPTKDKPSLPEEFETFINTCKGNLKDLPEVNKKRKLRTIRKSALHALNYIASEEFKVELQTLQDEVDKDPQQSPLCLVQLYKLLASKEDAEPQEFGEDEKRTMQLDDLYDKLEKVKTRIHEHENEEVDFEQEENSAFMKCQKYSEKAAEILCAIAKLENHSQYDGQAYFSRLDFTKSNILAFNSALNKKYRNRELHEFPSFYDVNKCLRKCAKKNGMKLGESDLKTEIEFCFKELGKLLKKRRQKDLQSVHHHYLKDLQDPAAQDPELERKLKENRKVCKNKLEEVLQKFTGLQETSVEPELSEDSDDSRKERSDHEDDADSEEND